MTKLDLYDVMTNSYSKFQVNISKESREKSGKQKCDGQTDGQTASKLRAPPPPRQAGSRLIKSELIMRGQFFYQHPLSIAGRPYM